MPIKETDISFGASGMDYYLTATDKIEVQPVTETLLQQFSKVAENVLVHQAERDLWQISDDGKFIQRMFDTEGQPMKMEAASTETIQKAASADKQASIRRAREIILLLEDRPGAYLRTSRKTAEHIWAQDLGKNFRYILSQNEQKTVPVEKEFVIVRKSSTGEATPIYNIQDVITSAVLQKKED